MVKALPLWQTIVMTEATTTTATPWYVHKLVDEHCEISSEPAKPGTLATWGPYPSQDEAIARRVGLIRAGKCKPKI
jgi:hypothetical protein